MRVPCHKEVAVAPSVAPSTALPLNSVRQSRLVLHPARHSVARMLHSAIQLAQTRASARRELRDGVLCVIRHGLHLFELQFSADVLEGSKALQITRHRTPHGEEHVMRQ